MAKEIVTTFGDLVEVFSVQPEHALVRVLKVRMDEQLRYHAMKLQKFAVAALKDFEERRNELIAELGAERPPTGAERAQRGGDPVMAVTPENLAEYGKRVKELLAVKVTIPWGPITREQVKDCPDITGKDLIELGPLFELDPPTDEK